jgi:hypothetical protein
MNFLLFCAFVYGLRLLVIQLIITAFLVHSLGSVTSYNAISFTHMPVTTRSQAKLSTGSTNELSATFLTGSSELSDTSSQFSFRKDITVSSCNGQETLGLPLTWNAK